MVPPRSEERISVTLTTSREGEGDVQKRYKYEKGRREKGAGNCEEERDLSEPRGERE